jgi:hypothetical protein
MFSSYSVEAAAVMADHTLQDESLCSSRPAGLRAGPITVSWEFVIQLAVILVTIVFAWSQLDSRITMTERDVSRIERAMEKKFEIIDIKLDALLGMTAGVRRSVDDAVQRSETRSQAEVATKP